MERFATTDDRPYLAFLGIDQGMAERIAAQFAAHGENMEGVRVANTQAWTDPVAVRTYRAAMNKDIDSIIVVPGKADLPLASHTPIGRALFQFKSFTLASHQRVMMRGLQEKPTRFIGGMVAMTSLGMLQVTEGGDVEPHRQAPSFLDNPGYYIAEGLDRSGTFPVFMELANDFEKLTDANPIKRPVKAFPTRPAPSRRRTRIRTWVRCSARWRAPSPTSHRRRASPRPSPRASLSPKGRRIRWCG